jgi:hypothetical protein
MEENRNLPLDPHPSESQPRRYVYRSVEPDSNLSHPLRRSTDTPRQFQAPAGQLCSRTQLLKFRVYLKLN